MSDNVVSLAEARIEREPHWAGTAVCLHCRHEWEAIGPMDALDRLDCPSCELPRGTVKYNFGADVGEAVATCLCGCQACTVVQRGDALHVICMACGSNLMDVR